MQSKMQGGLAKCVNTMRGLTTNLPISEVRPMAVAILKCRSCGRDKPPGERCKPCASRRTAEYRARYPDRAREAGRHYYATHAERERELAKAWAAANPDKVRAMSKAYYEANAETVRQRARDRRNADVERARERERAYNAAHPEQARAKRERHAPVSRLKRAEWKRNNKGLVNASTAARFAAKRRATPAWADLSAIKEFYVKAAELGLHVDHIVPLRSKYVCGFHCEANLQLLLRTDNLRKGNRHWPDTWG